ncbi:MAG: hypothetical protein K6F75_01010 [Butyrivibrio sp.]|nr:hypothetical protein [Butyrivibrio sp.]
MDALNRLIDQSDEVKASVHDIGDTINSTNDSAKEISKFSQAITEIASQTNLLSLNASIEAARAGDAGKSFTVVATEIGQLAVQSSNSADEIKKIVEIIADLSAISEENAASSEETNASMQELNATFAIITESAGKL